MRHHPGQSGSEALGAAEVAMALTVAAGTIVAVAPVRSAITVCETVGVGVEWSPSPLDNTQISALATTSASTAAASQTASGGTRRPCEVSFIGDRPTF